MLKLSSEDVCRSYMEEMRWGNNPVCPHCGAPNPYRLRDGKKFRCKSKTCKRNFTVTVGTVFENSKIELRIWIAAGYLLSAHKKGISSHQLSRDLGITQKSAWFVLQRLRLIMGEPNPEPLQNVVEIDETYIGGRLANMNRKKRKAIVDAGTDNKIPVMGLVQRDGKARLTVIGKNSFKDVVRLNVDKSATIATDSHLSYQGLDQEFAAHGTVNHTINEFRNGIFYTNSVEGFFSLFKRTIFGTYHQISPKHLHRACPIFS
ncbi:MAG TPA: IS1595 family transposase [Puia sp.]|nr:IS1595 family transposase [Puia sp.]